MKIKKVTGIIAVMICALFVLEAGALAAPVYAAENESGAVEPLVNVPNGFDKQELSALFSAGTLIPSGDDTAKITAEEKYGGLLIQGKSDKLSDLRLTLTNELDFGETPVSRIVFNCVSARKISASLALYLDDEAAPAATVALPKQNKKGEWTVEKNLCSDLSALKISGKHKVSVGLVYDESLGSVSVSALLRSFFFTAQTVPVMDVNIDEADGTIAEMNNDYEHKTECYGSVTLNVPDGYKSEYSEKTYKSGTYELEYIRGRGNSTWDTPKKPYKLKLEKKQDFFGMGANKHWVLLANYYDYTMLRNKYTYWLGEKLGMEYTPQCVFIDLVMNGQYLGSYYLCEQVRVGKSRVDIDDLEDSPELSEGDGITGGYLLSMGDDGGEYRMVSTNNISFLIENPEFTEYKNEAQYNYISDYIRKTDEAIYSDNFRSSEGKHYSEYLDVDSAIDYYLIQEFSMNGDAFGSGSTYLYKKRNGKLYWGPLWDFDYVAWGATEFYGNGVDGICCNYTPWFRRLMSDPEFMAKLLKRWAEIKPILLESAKDGGKLDEYARELYLSQKSNYYVAKTLYDSEGGFIDDYEFNFNAENFEGTDISPYNPESETVVNFDTEVQRFKQWINERAQWLDENISDLIPAVYNVIFKVDNKVYKHISTTFSDLFEILPESPKKDGYRFDGWYTKDNGYEESIDDFYFPEEVGTVNFYAKWKKLSNATATAKVVFPYKDYYIWGNDVSYDEYDSDFIPYSVMPFDTDTSKIVWSVDDDNMAKISDNGYFTPLASYGTVRVTATLGKSKATCTVHIGNNDSDDLPVKMPKNGVSVTVGKYSRIRLTNPPTSLWRLSELKFISTDKKVVQVDNNGYIYGKKAGTAYIFLTGYGDDIPLFCKVTVKPAPIKKGSKLTVGNLKYKVTSVGKKRAVTVTGVKNTKAKTVTIPATIKAQGKKYKVTAVAAKAFKKLKKLTKVTIKSKTIKKIGEAAFPKSKKIKYSLPKSKKKAYKKLLKLSGK